MTKNVICGSNNSNSVVFWAATIYTFFLSVHCSCDSPPRLSYAGLKTEHMDTNIFPIGSVVRYECRPGYMKIPMKKYTAECLANATWSKPDEFCKKKVCKYPGDIYYGYFNETDFSVGSRVTYFCDKGYIMISKKNYRYCQVDGSWSNSAPVCEAVTCPPPKHVSGVIYNPQREEYTYLESVKYRCIADKLEIIGERYTFCTEDGTWSNHPPKCIDVICPNPVVPYSNKLSGFINPYKLNYAVTFECKEGFSMKGSDTITCGIDSQWKPQIPSCLRVNCSIPMVPNSKKLSASMGPYKLNDIVRFECVKGFAMQGSDTITCGVDSQWKPQIPSCLRVNCSIPMVPNSKKLSASMGPYKLNDIVRFECVEGFSIKGFDTITCGVDSQWKPQIPSCLPTAGEACPEPIVPHGIIRKQENVLNGTSGSEGYSVGQLVKIECDLHYGLNGHNILTCGSDLLWYPNIPVCQPKHFCPEPKVFHGQIINGTPVYLRNGIEKGYKVGDVIKLKCDPKHHLKGKNSIFCGSDMKWHPRIPICEHRLGCSYPEIKNGLIVLRNGDTYNPELNFSFFLGDTVQVKCKPGFAMYGNERSKCGGYFEWSPDLPICVQGNKQ
uniref:Sushi domain-containing protein n=1 Tax=Xenopus tropicalis TaxID=8364 RepID=A0A803JPB1_XENTR